MQTLWRLWCGRCSPSGPFISQLLREGWFLAFLQILMLKTLSQNTEFGECCSDPSLYSADSECLNWNSHTCAHGCASGCFFILFLQPGFDPFPTVAAPRGSGLQGCGCAAMRLTQQPTAMHLGAAFGYWDDLTDHREQGWSSLEEELPAALIPSRWWD